jgi:hypothetical protein
MKNPGILCFSSAMATLFMIYNVWTATEGVSQTLAVMNYLFIACLAGVTIFCGVMWLSKR